MTISEPERVTLLCLPQFTHQNR